VENIATVIYGAILIEALVNVFKNVRTKETSVYYWGSLAVGILGGVLIAYNWAIDLFSAIGFPEGRIPFVGAILTGIILSRGANVASDLFARLNSWKVG
jgi:hypothetical protein